MQFRSVLLILSVLSMNSLHSQQRPRDLGIEIGILRPGQHNAITDVPGVRVGHFSLVEGDHIRTGVTAILPHDENIFRQKVPAAIYIGNGFGKLAGYSQVKELGTIETPVILTNTLSVPVAMQALMKYTLHLEENEDVRSVNPVVGETNDGFLNDIRGMHITEEHVLQAIEQAHNGAVPEGNVGAGTGTVCFGFKGGIGTASRLIPKNSGGYTLGVLVQTNFGGVLEIGGVPVAKLLDKLPNAYKNDTDGSCMIVVATNAPLDARNLERLAKRAFMALAKTGGIASNGSGDYVIAFSTAEANRLSSNKEGLTVKGEYLKNEAMSPLFLAAIEATEEAIINSLFAAESMSGRDGNNVEALPVNRVLEMMKQHGKIREE